MHMYARSSARRRVRCQFGLIAPWFISDLIQIKIIIIQIETLERFGTMGKVSIITQKNVRYCFTQRLLSSLWQVACLSDVENIIII